jgi:hypothetical protein
VAVAWTDLIRPSALNELRAGFSRDFAHSDPVGLTVGKSAAGDYGLSGIPPGPMDAGIPPINISGLTRLGSSPWRPQVQIAQVWQLLDTLSWLKGGHSLGQLDTVGLHALRIEIKKLRYATDFFSALYKKGEVREYSTTLATLQELLGGLNDAVTVERLLEPLRESDGAAQSLEASGLIRGWSASNSRSRLDQLGQAWQHFRDSKVFWR